MKSVAGLHLTDTCNLMLLDENNTTIWQSFDYPTDTLVLVQKWVAATFFILVETGQQLTSQGRFFSKRGVEKLGFCRSTSQHCASTKVDFVIQQVNGAREEKAMRSELRTNCVY